MAQNGSEPEICPGPQLQVNRPLVTVPRGAADCHAHVFGPRERYPYSPKRYYTPPNDCNGNIAIPTGMNTR
jgi:2-pyrone-4,6-dicarboxylate lactonase